MSLKLRPATIGDAKLVFAWRNDPWIVARGTTGQTVSWEEHYTWFKEVVAGHNRQMFIVLYQGKPIGQVRFDRVDDDACEISIYLIREYTGRGLGVSALKLACEAIFDSWDISLILAFIRDDNASSVSAFRKAGFSPADGDTVYIRQDHIELRITRPVRVPHNRLTFGEEEVQAVADVVSSGQWSAGPRQSELEHRLAEHAQVAHAVCVSSGLSALRLTLKGLGLGPEDEVIVPAYSCVALANAAMALGAEPVTVDVRDCDWNLDPLAARAAITPRTRAIVLVNTFGAPAPIKDLRHLEIPLIEDCAHGFGLDIGGEKLGGRGDAAILSLYATKLMGAGGGGAILTNNRDLAEFVCAWRDYSDQPPDSTRLNNNMNDLEAALALCQLDRLDTMLIDREQVAQHYQEYLAPIAESTRAFRMTQASRDRVWYRYVIEMRSVSALFAIKKLKECGVHAERPVTDWRTSDDPECPIADRAYESLVSLPMFPTLSHDEQIFVCDKLRAVAREISDV